MPPEWLPLLQHASSLGILLVIRLHSLDELNSMTLDFVEAVLNLGSRLFLEPNSEGALTLAVNFLAPGQDVKDQLLLRRRLASLGPGAALLHPWDLSRPKQVRFCTVDARTRSEALSRRQP